MENATNHAQGYGRDKGLMVNKPQSFAGKPGGSYNSRGAGHSGQWNGRGFRDGKDNRVEDIMRKVLEGHKFKGKEFCIGYNLMDANGESKCKDRRCSRAHNCGFIPRGQNRPCSKPHPKFEHGRM